MESKYDYVIVGAGLWGSLFAYIATQRGKKCLVIDKRPHIGGNLYCEDIDGINVHKYGAHIFHTDNKEIWEFVNGITEFNRYTNSPISINGNECYNLPFNMNTFSKVFGLVKPSDVIERINDEISSYQFITDGKISNLKDQAINLVGYTIYNKLIKGYTEKQWGKECEELPPEIIKRLPLRFTYDNNYYNDKYQGIPIGGYNKLFDELLKNADVELCSDFFDKREYYISICDKLVYTGRIDEFYNYKFGYLEYRTLRWDFEVLDIPNYQGCAVVNYQSKDVDYTRIIEHKHFQMFNEQIYDNNKTVISKEYSEKWSNGKECYYPINDSKNNDTFKLYWNIASTEKNVIFGGRLAEYKYYDMDDIIKSVFNLLNII